MRFLILAILLATTTPILADTLEQRNASWDKTWAMILRNGGDGTKDCAEQHCSISNTGTDNRGRTVFMQIDTFPDGSVERDYCRLVDDDHRNCTDWDSGKKTVYHWENEKWTLQKAMVTDDPVSAPEAQPSHADYAITVEALMASGSPDEIWANAERYIAAHAGQWGKACVAGSCTYNYASAPSGNLIIQKTLRRADHRDDDRELCTINSIFQRHCVNVDTKQASDWRKGNGTWDIIK